MDAALHAAHLVRDPEPLVSEGHQMTGPNGKGVNITSANAPETHENQHLHCPTDGGASKALATMQARAEHSNCRLNELSDGGCQPSVDLVEASRCLDMMADGEAVTSQTFDDDASRKSSALARIEHGDVAAKAIATAIATAACLGIECHAVGRDRWLLRHARGTDIGLVQGPGALIAAVGGFVCATEDVRALVQRLAAAKVERRAKP